ncbi:hypothetical protein BJ546DRAFT_589570 [Cryomyces antarcticus]
MWHVCLSPGRRIYIEGVNSSLLRLRRRFCRRVRLSRGFEWSPSTGSRTTRPLIYDVICFLQIVPRTQVHRTNFHACSDHTLVASFLMVHWTAQAVFGGICRDAGAVQHESLHDYGEVEEGCHNSRSLSPEVGESASTTPARSDSPGDAPGDPACHTP